MMGREAAETCSLVTKLNLGKLVHLLVLLKRHLLRCPAT